jgi:hypothetical protein
MLVQTFLAQPTVEGLEDQPMRSGEQRRVGFVLLSGEEAARELRGAGKFYLWEGRFVGEAIVIE